MKLVVHQYDIPLRHAFATSRSTTERRQSLVVEIQEEGLSGFGEVGGSAVKELMRSLKRVRPWLEPRS